MVMQPGCGGALKALRVAATVEAFAFANGAMTIIVLAHKVLAGLQRLSFAATAKLRTLTFSFPHKILGEKLKSQKKQRQKQKRARRLVTYLQSAQLAKRVAKLGMRATTSKQPTIG